MRALRPSVENLYVGGGAEAKRAAAPAECQTPTRIMNGIR